MNCELDTFLEDCNIVSQVVTATDEDELAARIRKAEEENAEVRKPYISHLN